MLYSHELCSTRAKNTEQRGQSNNFLYTVSYQQIKTWSLLSEGNQSKSWKKVWANWNCLSLVTSHVIGTSRAEHTTSYMLYNQMKTFSSFTTRQPIQILKKVWPLFVLCLITSHDVSNSRAERTTSYMSCKQRKTLSSFTARQPIQILGKGVTSGFVVTGDGVYDTWEQFIAGVHKNGNIF
jgi:hypothetical protein